MTPPAGRITGGGAILLGVTLLTAGALLLDGPSAGRATTPGFGALPAAVVPVAPPPVPADPSVPRELRGPLGLRADLVPVAAGRDGVLGLPEDVRLGGWWALGAPVGSRAGTTLLAGHVDSRRSGLGAFAVLHRLGPGSRVEVRAANGRVYRYVVTARRLYARTALPTDLFSREGPHRLALLTCAGTYDAAAAAYDSNVVLYASPA
ncbi:class F sortase [Streptomyces sp. NPDC016459]|uniref:class F sortase n=1 Tax=Streptomyces sp. NPDC016459 TaxID=3157190 RepID=UPI0033C9F752